MSLKICCLEEPRGSGTSMMAGQELFSPVESGSVGQPARRTDHEDEDEIAAGLRCISVALVFIGQQRRSSIQAAHCAICYKCARRIGTNELFLMSRRLHLASTR